MHRLLLLLVHLLSGRGFIGLLVWMMLLLLLLFTGLERRRHVPPAHPQALHSGRLSVVGDQALHRNTSCSFLMLGSNHFVWGGGDKGVLLLELLLVEVHLRRIHPTMHLVANHDRWRNFRLLVLVLVLLHL